MWSKLYNIVSFLFLFLFFVICYFLLDMFFVTFSVEKSYSSALSIYMDWLYLYISALSIFLLKHGLLIYSVIFVALNVYNILKYKKFCLESIVFLLAAFFHKLSNSIYNKYFISKLNLVPIVSRSNLLIKFNYTTLGMVLNLFMFLVFILLLVVLTKFIRKEYRKGAKL